MRDGRSSCCASCHAETKRDRRRKRRAEALLAEPAELERGADERGLLAASSPSTALCYAARRSESWPPDASIQGRPLLAGAPSIKAFGVGLSVAILVNATVVRLVLVPVTMRLLGDWNWWLPRPLARILHASETARPRIA